jgi:hypothetical protein
LRIAHQVRPTTQAITVPFTAEGLDAALDQLHDEAVGGAEAPRHSAPPEPEPAPSVELSSLDSIEFPMATAMLGALIARLKERSVDDKDFAGFLAHSAQFDRVDLIDLVKC